MGEINNWYCNYHEIECDYAGKCKDCPHNTEEDAEWFEQVDAEYAELENKNNCKYCQHLRPFADDDIESQYESIICGREISLGVLGVIKLHLDMDHFMSDDKYYLTIWEDLFDCDTNDSVEIHYCPFCGRKLDE